MTAPESRPVEDSDVEALVNSIAGCISNVSLLPKWMQAPALGRDTRPILEFVARAVIASAWLARHDAEVERRAAAKALRGIEQFAHERREYLRPELGPRTHGTLDGREWSVWNLMVHEAGRRADAIEAQGGGE